MATPPRRWVGYALLIAGLSLLFDTYTFLRTNWSPLHVPMFIANELALGYSFAVVGVIVLFAPTLVRMVDSYAPDASMKMGEGLAHDRSSFAVSDDYPSAGNSQHSPIVVWLAER